MLNRKASTSIRPISAKGVDLGKLYDYDIILLDLNLPDMSAMKS
jgi:DNA-binding response OmpR family regulator